MATYDVSLFGRFTARRNDQPLPALNARRLQELLSYLLLYRDRPHSRESLADLLWGDRSTAQSKKCLRQALWEMQNALNDPEQGIADLLVIEPDWIEVNSEVDLQLDVTQFEEAFTRCRGIAGADLSPDCLALLQQAVQLYRGDLLEGWYHDWCLYERERFQTMYVVMLDKLMAACEAHGDFELGLTYGARILHQDGAHERTHRRMMRLYYLLGDRTAALRQYQRCVAALDEELNVGPSRRTMALYEQISSDQPIEPVTPRATMPAAPPPPEALTALHQLHGLLAEMLTQIERYTGRA